MQRSDHEILMLYEIEWALEDGGPKRRKIPRLRQLVRHAATGLIICAAAWFPSRELADFLTSGFRR